MERKVDTELLKPRSKIWNIPENGMQTQWREKEFANMKMEKNMLGCLNKVIDMERELIPIRVERSMKVNGNLIKKLDRGNLFSQIKKWDMKVHFYKIKEKEME